MLSEAAPPLKATLPRSEPAVQSMNSTDPVGVPSPEPGATVAVSVVVWPSTAGVEVKTVEVGVAEMVPCSARVWVLVFPTAQHSVPLIQVTPVRMPATSPSLGVKIDHAVPSQCSRRVGEYPTAQQSDAVVHETPVR